MAGQEGSEYDRLFYPFLFEGGQSSAEEVLAQASHSTLEKGREIVTLRRKALEQLSELILEAGAAMAAAFARGATLLAFGNGGSATDAQDIVANLLRPPWPDLGPLPAIALADNMAMVTAVGNDVGFDKVFARQIIAFGRAGDIAFGISSSGNSLNLLAAFEQAKKQKLLTVGLVGYDGGKMAQAGYLDFCLVIPSDSVTRIQDAQATVYHALVEVVFARLEKEQAVA